MESKEKDVIVLSENVMKYLDSISESAKGEIQDTVNTLSQKYKR